MKTSILSIVFILSAVFVLDTQARGDGSGSNRMQGQRMGHGMGSRQSAGDMDRDQTRLRQHQQTPGQIQDEQLREMNQEQNRIQ